MDKKIEKKVIDFIRIVATSGINPIICNNALDLLLEIGNTETDIGGIKVSVDNYKNIIKEIKNSKKIQAIKLLRQVTGLGLKESKDAIDKWMEDNFSKEEGEEESQDW